jgi:hypothetical protein
MLRAVLLGLLTLSVVSCHKKDDAPAAQAGAPAGTVVEVTGAVTIAGKPLAKGATVAGDDVVETGADGHVRIVLAHNNATWELGPNKHEKVSASLAWTLAKVDTPAKAVDQDTSSAGRPAERSAADTEASAKKDMEVAPAPAAAAAQAPPAEMERADEPAKNAPAPPPPPPPPAPSLQPPPRTTAHAAAAPADDAVMKPGGGGGGGRPEVMPKTAKVDVPVEAYQKCVTAGMTLKLTLKGTAKGTTYTVTNGVKLSADVKACLDKVTAGVKLPAGAHSDLEIAK